MGGVQEQSVDYDKEELKNSHPSFVKGWVVREKNKRSYLQCSYAIQEKGYKEWRSRVEKAASFPNSQFSFLPLDMGYIQNNQMCSKHGSVLVNYPEYPYLLSDQIKRRQAKKDLFKQKQLYYLLYALVAVKIEAKQRGEVVGDIKPQNVFINRQENIKIGILSSFPYQRTNYGKAIDALSPSKNVILAPEDLLSAKERELDNKNNVKSEVFSIGATVISAGLLTDFSETYDYPNNTFLKGKHSAKTAEWLEQENYTQIFKSIVLNLINPEPQQRISIEDLWAFLSKYKSSILAKEPFIVTKPPSSLELGVSIIRSKVY